MRDDDREVCLAHIEFQRRIDDRWRDHVDMHRAKQEELCSEIRELRKELSDVKTKLYWILGGAAILIPLLQVIVPMILHIK